MASSFLRKKAEEQAKRIDEQYGATAYGGSSYRKASGTEDKSETGTGSRASSYLQKKAQAQAEKMNQKYGTGASETKTSTSTPTSTRSSRPNAGRGDGTVKTAADIGYDIRQTQSQLDALEQANADGYYSVEDLALAGSLNQQLAQLRNAQDAAEKVERQALITSGEYRDATLKDLTLGSLQQGWYNTRYGEESFDAMMGNENQAQQYKEILEGEEYKFLPDGLIEEALSGGAGLLGQMLRQTLNERTIGLAAAGGTGGAMYGTVAGGGLGSGITAPVGAAAGIVAGITAGNAAASWEVEGGHAYNELVEKGVSPATAKNVAMVVGGVNAALEALQVDELVDSFKILKKSGATQDAAQKIAQILLDRGIDVAKETVQEVAQEGVTIAGTQIGSKLDKGEWAYNADEVKDRLLDTAKSSALSFGLLNVPGAIRNVTSPGNVQTQTQETAKDGEVFQTQEPEAEKRPQIPAPALSQDTSEGVYTSEEKQAAEALTGQKNTASTNKGEAAEVIKVLSDSIPALKAEPIVAKTSSQAFREVPGNTMAEKARKLFEGIKGIVARPGFGDVEINGRSVKDDLSHGVGPAKAATIASVPQVIQRGKQVDYQENWKGRGYDGYVFAAPVEMDGETVYVAAVVKKTSKNRFYLHEVVDSNGNIIKIDDIESANPTSLAANGDAGTQSPSSTSGFTIAHPADSVNTAVRRQDNTADEITRRTAQLRSDIQTGAQKTLGKEGYRAFEADFRNTPESDPIETYQQLTRAYNEGVANRRSTDSTLPAARYNAMFEAGRKDAEASLQAQVQQAGQAVVHKGGIDYADTATSEYMKTSADQKTAKVVDRAAKALGVQVRFADSVAGGEANAQIENGVVTIEKGNPNPVRFLFGHEITHRMQELAPAEYARLREAAAEYGWMDAYIKRTQQKYAEHGRSIDSEAAADEAVADFVGTLLEDNGELERFIARSQGDRTLLQKLKDAVHDLVVKLKGTEEQKRMLDVEKRLTEALKAASKQAETNAKTQKNATQKGGVKNSLKLGGFADVSIDVQAEVDFFGIKSFNDYVGVQKSVYNKLLKAGFFDAATNRRTIENADTGIAVEIGRDGIFETFGPGMRYARLPGELKRLKIATVRHLPEIIRYGEVVEGDVPNVHNAKSDLTYTYVEHPITVGNKTFYVTVDIRRSRQTNKFWVHHVHVDAKKGQVLAANADKAGSALNEDLATGDNVARPEDVVKRNTGAKLSLKDSEGRTLSEGQREYFKDSKARDDKGQLMVLYHGTDTSDHFSQFKTYHEERFDDEDSSGYSIWQRYGAYTSTNKQAAGVFAAWGTPKMNLIPTATKETHDAIGQHIAEKGSSQARIYQMYANLVKPLIVDAHGSMWDEIDISEYEEINGDMAWAEGEVKTDDLAEYAWNSGYDGLIIKNVREADGKYLGDDVIVFEPSQLKYTDNLNPTKDPDIRHSLKDSTTLAREIARIQKEGAAGKRSDADIRADIRAAVDEAYQGVIADHDAKIKELKKHQRAKEEKGRESRTAVALRAKIQRHAKDLSNKLLNPNDKKHIPEALRGPVAHLLESINLESNYELEYGADAKYHRVKPGESLFAEATKRTKAFAELRKAYAEIADELIVDPDLLGDDGLLNDMAALADKRLLDMTSAELETVWQTIRAVEASIRSANKMFSAAKQKTITEIAEALRSENAGKSAKTEYNGALGKGQKLTGLDMMTPEAFLHRLGSTGDAMFRMMRNAQDEHIRMMKEVADFTHSAMKDVDVKKLEKTMHTVTLGGENVKLSTAQLMELYVLMRREQALEHIMRGGILPDVVSNQGAKKIAKVEPSRGITMEELSKALSLLSDKEVAVAETLQGFASTKLSEYGNKASMQVYNYKKFNEKNYWPIRSNRQEVRSDVQTDTAVTSVANRGFTKGTKPHANNSVRLGSIFDTFATHASEMATYAAWLGTSEDINRIRNYTFRDGKGNRTGTVKGIIERVHGTQGSAYLQKLLADIATGVRGTHGETAFMSGIAGNYKAASVGANLRVIIQQPTAILRAMDMIAPQYLAAGVLPNGGWKKALKYAPIAQWKDWGYFDINTGRQMKDVLFNSDSALDKVKNASMAGAGAMDSLAWGLLWNSVEAETKAKRKDLKAGTDEFYQTVAERFTEIVDHTQVVDGILQRSQIMRSSDGLTKMATSFMAEPTKQYNMLLSAAYDAKHGSKNDRTAAKQRLARTAFALTASGVVNAMAQSVLDGLRDDDKEKKYLEKWLNAFFGFTGEEEGLQENWDAFWSGNLGNTVNPAAYIPYVKDILSLLQGYDVSRMDMESVEKTITAAQNMTKALSGEGKYTIAGASANLFAEAARLIGMPVANLKREVKAFAMTAAIESDNYVMQYRMEKAALSMNYSGNSGTFMDILFNAYVNDQNAYEIIYADMVSSGYDTAKIKSGMETRMKKAQGVNEAADLEQRYLSPDQQAGYDGTMEAVSGSKLWSKASAEQRDDLEDSLYNLIVGNSTGSSMQEKIDGGAVYGIDKTDYLLYKLALDMADKPNDNGKFGTYTNDEVEEAIKMLTGLSDDARAYLWEAQGKNAKSNPWK